MTNPPSRLTGITQTEGREGQFVYALEIGEGYLQLEVGKNLNLLTRFTPTRTAAAATMDPRHGIIWCKRQQTRTVPD